MEEERKSKPNDEISEQRKEEEEVVYKTKVIQFLGRSTPIILQNDNGPCPLLAICNVLLLRNSLNLSVDVSEVSLQKLLSLVAEKLIDSNSNVQDKDEEYLINQQQNIADAIDLLPRLATGIDVNVQFRRINDFEFTRECAIFDLLDIGLYHGWIVDPQDTETTSAIGSKSYNTLVGELVAFEAGKSAVENGHILEEDFVDFVAATTAALGVPSPCLSRGISFEECPVTVPVEHGGGKGEREESEELMRALNLSKIVMSTPDDVSNSPDINSPHILERIHRDSSEAQVGVRSEESQQLELLTPQQCNASIDLKDDGLNSKLSSLVNDSLSSNANVVSKMDHSISEDSREFTISNDSIETARTDSMMPNHILSFQSTDEKGSDEFPTHKGLSQDDASVSQMCTKDMFTYDIPNRPADHPMACGRTVFTVQSEQHAESNPSNGRQELLDVSDVGSSCLDTTEPIYEGEECVVDSGHLKYEDREPVYEGEIFLAQQADKVEDAFVNSEDKVGLQQCNLIRNFLENSASQLTIYGLFCLQEGLKERELCVFFRNNHFNTLFKFNGDLYILATDQGYINQPDLVWEKLNEVNGDTVFMTGNFTEFNIENQVNQSWNEQNALTSTADYLATLEASTPANSSVNSDLQLAIALQQQEFGQQTQQPTQRSQQQSSQQAAVSGRSRLVTGPHQVSRNSQASHKNEQKKEKCIIM